MSCNDCVHRGSVLSTRTDDLGELYIYQCPKQTRCVSSGEDKDRTGGAQVVVCGPQCPDYERREIFDRVVVINLERRPDRLEQMRAEFAKGWPFKQPIVHRAVDGNRCPAPAGYSPGNHIWSCFQSHRRALEDAINDGCQSILVLEDDATFCEGFSEKAVSFMESLPDDWEFAWLGGHHLRYAHIDGKPVHIPPPIYVSPGVVKSVWMDRCHAYAARGQGLLDLYKLWHQWHSAPCDHALGRWMGTRKSYCAQPWLVGQRGGPSDLEWNVKGPEWWHTNDIQNAPQREPVGTEVAKILKSLGIPHTGCQKCAEMIRDMDQWGIAGCLRYKHRILARLRAQASQASIRTKLKAGALGALQGLATEISWKDPAPGILRIAISNCANRV